MSKPIETLAGADAAAFQAAIAPHVAVVTKSLSASRIENKAALRNLLVELYDQGAASSLFGVITCGDSVSPRVGEHIAIGLRARYGDGGTVCPVQSGFADLGSDTTLSASTGAIAQGDVSAASYPYLPNNKHIVMPNGATLTFRARANGHSTITRIMAWLVKRPGDGSALLEVKKISDGTVAASWDTGSLDGVDGTLVKANAGEHFVGLDSTIPYELKVTATGTVCFLTALFARDSGVVHYQAGLGGSPVSKQIPALQGSAWQGIMADLNVRLMIHEDKTEDAGASYAVLMAAWKAIPDVAGLFIGSLPDGSGSAAQLAVIELLREQALANDYAFFNGYAAMKDYAETTRLGLHNDGVHLQTAAYWVVANAILSELHFNDPRLPVLGQTANRASSYGIYRGDGYGPQSKEVRFVDYSPGVARVRMWNIDVLALKSNQTEATDSPTAQVRMVSYSNFGVQFLGAGGAAAYLTGVGGIHMGTGSGTGASSGKIEPNYNSWRLKFTMTNGAGSTTKDATLEIGGIRVGGFDMLTARGAAVAAPAGGAVVDAEARTAIGELISRLQNLGVIAP